MKANEAPEKLYLHPTAKGNVGASWLIFQLTDDDIEYIRTDALIEKACEYFAPHISDNSGGYDRARIIEDFKNYMKGE